MSRRICVVTGTRAEFGLLRWLMEVPSFKTGTINIGEHQKGRLKAQSVNDCEPNRQAILDTLELMESDVQLITDEQQLRPGKSEVFRLWGCNSKLRKLTGLSSVFDLRSELKKTIAWFTRPENLS